MDKMDTKDDIDTSIKQELAAEDGSFSGIEDEGEYEPYPFDVEKISIRPKPLLVSLLISRVNRGLIHAAELQRNENLWDLGKKSRLIESLMLKIPLPLFYAAGTKNDELFIVDGLQRISAIKSFVKEDGFALQGLEYFREFEGKTYSTLPERMRTRIDETELNFVVIDPDSPPAIQRNIFKRLNTGGLPLTEQEIRHALYYGHVTIFLKELVSTKEFNEAVAGSVNDSRMAAQELVLRFLSFSIRGINEYRKDGEMDSFLSDTMQIINKMGNTDTLQEKFIKAMTRARELFSNCAFRISTPIRLANGTGIRTPVNKSLFEVWSVLLSDMPDDEFDKLDSLKRQLYEKLEQEFTSEGSVLRNYIGKDSTKAAAVRGRYEIVKKIIANVIMEGK
ncbi:MAG: DUF262 domain-containing protein [Tannerellaceae bacterium]|jgi:hypothetical protein|nr:DUF262 domain-containing protein [Tannerellaceae bacterium]